MPPKRKAHVPPVRANADGTGFKRVDEPGLSRANLARLAPPTSSSAPRATDRREQPSARPSRAPGRAAVPNADDDTDSTSDFTSPSSSASSTRSSSPPRAAAVVAAQRPNRAEKTAVKPKAPVTTSTPVETTPSRPSTAPVVKPTPAPRPATTTSSRNCAAVTVPLTLAVDSALLSSEVKLSPSRCRQLAVGSGALVRVSAADGGPAVMVAEVLLSTSQAAESVAMNNDAASLFDGRAVLVEALVGPNEAMTVLRSVTLRVQPRHMVDQDLTPSAGSAAQWSALFRRHYQHRVAYKGMRTTLRLATHGVEVDVVDVSVAPPSRDAATLPFGMISEATAVDVVFATPGETTTEEASAAVPITTTPARHTLVVGGPGTGKTYQLAQLATDARRAGRHVLVVRAEEIPQGESGEVHSAAVVAELFEEAKHLAPCLVCLDDVDLLCGAAGGSGAVGSQWAMTLVATALCEQLRDLHRRRLDVCVAASAASQTSLHPSLLAPDYLGGTTLTLSPPASADARLACFEVCLRALLGAAAWDAVAAKARQSLLVAVTDAHGYTQRDLHRVAQAALLSRFETCGNVKLEREDVEKALKVVRPSALRQFEVSVPDTTWDDIGGSAEAKRTLQEVVEWCLGKQSWIFTQFKITPPKGVLLYGPPGCSKTMLAKALANESRMNFVSVKGPEIFSKWVGDSEKAIRDIFARARAASPCVVFIDELDGMCGHRGRGGVSDRVVSQFLTELDGLPAAFASEKTALVFVAATNRPDSIDEAVLRPGRIDRLVYVGLPDKDERAAIAAIQLAKLPVAPDLAPAYVAERTGGYTGAEVVAVVKESAFSAVATNLQAPFITCDDVDAALKKVLPRIAPKEVEWYHQWAHGKR